jgi:hypothetical protein
MSLAGGVLIILVLASVLLLYVGSQVRPITQVGTGAVCTPDKMHMSPCSQMTPVPVEP